MSDLSVKDLGVKDLATDATLTEEQTIKYALKYASVEDSETWSTVPEATGVSWDDFYNAVIALYPGVNSPRKYTVGDLERITELRAATPMADQDQLGAYEREFTRVSSFLLA